MEHFDAWAQQLIEAETPGALQRSWKVPAQFPQCPPVSSDHPLETYFENLFIGDVAVISPFNETVIVDTAMTADAKGILVLGEFKEKGMKDWSLIRITFENGYFVHESCGTFYFLDGAEKEFTLAQGLAWDGGDTFDEYC